MKSIRRLGERQGVDAMSLELVKDVIIPLASGISGAIVGAGASYIPARMLSKRASDEVLKRDKAARRDMDTRAAHQVYVKLHVIANSLGTFQKQIVGMVAKAESDGNGHMKLHERISNFAGIERERSIEFTAEELAIYIAAKRADYVDDLLLLARRYAVCLAGLETFAKLKTDLHYETVRFGRTTRDAKTGVAKTSMHVPPEIGNYVNVKGDELNLFTKDLCDQIAEYDAFARDVAVRFKEVTKSFLDGPMPGFAPKEDAV